LKLPKSIARPTYPEKCALHLILEKGDKKIAENLFLYLPDKYIDWPGVKITGRLVQKNADRCELTLRSNSVVKDIKLSAGEATFGDNFFDLIPSEQFKTVICCKKSISSVKSELQLVSFRLKQCLHECVDR